MGNEVPVVPPPPPGVAPPPPPPPAATAQPVPQPATQPAAAPAATPVSDQSGQTQDVSTELYLIPLTLIDLMEGQQHRIRRSEEKQAELTASIKANGQNDPVKVMKNGNRFTLVYGHGRLQALRDLKIKHIRAEIFHGNTQEAALLALSENVNREELNPIEIALGIREAIKRGSSLSEIAKTLGKIGADGTPDINWAEQHLELLSLNSQQREEVANNMMSKSVALSLAKMKADNRDKIFSEMEKIAEGEKKPSKSQKTKAAKAAKEGTPPPPPPPAPKKTAAVLDKAKAKVTGKSGDKFIGIKLARELYSEIGKLSHDFIPTDEKAVVKECRDLIDYLLGKRKSKPFQLDVD